MLKILIKSSMKQKLSDDTSSHFKSYIGLDTNT